MGEVLRVRTRDELIAVVPHLLGFEPADSLVCVPVEGPGPTARVDHPHNAEDLDEVAGALADAYHRHRSCSSVAVLAITAARHDADQAVDRLTAALGGAPAVALSLWVHEGVWLDLRTGETGAVTPEIANRVAAETVALGRALPRASRDELATSLVGNVEPLRRLLPGTLPHATRLAADGDLADETAWVLGVIDVFKRRQTPLSDTFAARTVAAVHQVEVRDIVLASMTRADAETYAALWRDLTRRTPAAHRAPVATLHAFACWLAGNGAEAWVALDQVEPHQDFPLARLVAEALTVAAPPTIWDAAQAQVLGGSAAPAARRAQSDAPIRRPDLPGPRPPGPLSP